MNREALVELFAAFGPINPRRMFGGFGIYAGATLIGIVSDATVYLVADPLTIPAFEAEGARCFAYHTAKRSVSIDRWWSLPERLYDDPDTLAEWAREALAAAQRRAAAAPAKRPASTGKRARKRAASTTKRGKT